MKLIICGFTDYNKLDKIMQKLIEDSQCFIFTILCGGIKQEGASRVPSLAEEWARKNGAPVEYVWHTDPEILLFKLSKQATYIVYDRSNATNWHARLLMKIKAEGGHGTVVN